jgi:hypothetical protein
VRREKDEKGRKGEGRREVNGCGVDEQKENTKMKSSIRNKRRKRGRRRVE